MAPAGGAPRVAVAEPDWSPPVSKPEPLLVPVEQEYARARVMPTSASWGWHARWAVRGMTAGAVVEVGVGSDVSGTHRQFVRQLKPATVELAGFHEPFRHSDASGWSGRAGHCALLRTHCQLVRQLDPATVEVAGFHEPFRHVAGLGSAGCAGHCGVGLGTHCQAVMHAPFIVGFHEPTLQLDAGGCCCNCC